MDFIDEVVHAADPLDVEEAWADFMSIWGGDLGVQGDIEGSISLAIVIFGALMGNSPADTFLNGVTTGGRLITLAIAYNIRVTYYLNLED